MEVFVSQQNPTHSLKSIKGQNQTKLASNVMLGSSDYPGSSERHCRILSKEMTSFLDLVNPLGGSSFLLFKDLKTGNVLFLEIV